MDNMLVTSGYHVDNHAAASQLDARVVPEMSRSVQGRPHRNEGTSTRPSLNGSAPASKVRAKTRKVAALAKKPSKAAVHPPEKSFHHGDLKSALVRESSRLIAERGEADFSLRELAEIIGVTHPAVYRHFKSKADVLSEIALQGFTQLDEMLVINGHFAQVLHAYMNFAQEKPGFYRAMFHPMLRDCTAFPAIDAAMEQLKARFVSQVPEAFGWSTAHGLAMLALDGRLLAEAVDTVLAYDVTAKPTPRRREAKKVPLVMPDTGKVEVGIPQIDQIETKPEPRVKASKAVKKSPIVDNTPSLFDFLL